MLFIIIFFGKKKLLPNEEDQSLYRRKIRRLSITEETKGRPSIIEGVKTMEVGLQVQIEKLEAKLKHYQRDNEELWDINTKSKMLIKLHRMQKERKEQKISD